MPVARYRDIAEMPDPARATTALKGLAAACDASTHSRAFGHTKRAPRGVRRFRSIEDADAHRQRWESGEARSESHPATPAIEDNIPGPTP